ncbi:MAG: hypothetical protein DSY33_00335 [Archaeoglobus sp.]|nr:MAG: hypothetical protein DSY33_00335 [Archaeoglobus sp.]
MVRETYTSEFLEKLTCISKEVKEKFGVAVWFAEILGRRWSYIAGEKAEEDLFLPPERVQLSDRLGVVIEGEANVEEIVRFIKERLQICRPPEP